MHPLRCIPLFFNDLMILLKLIHGASGKGRGYCA